MRFLESQKKKGSGLGKLEPTKMYFLKGIQVRFLESQKKGEVDLEN